MVFSCFSFVNRFVCVLNPLSLSFAGSGCVLCAGRVQGQRGFV